MVLELREQLGRGGRSLSFRMMAMFWFLGVEGWASSGYFTVLKCMFHIFHN